MLDGWPHHNDAPPTRKRRSRGGCRARALLRSVEPLCFSKAEVQDRGHGGALSTRRSRRLGPQTSQRAAREPSKSRASVDWPRNPFSCPEGYSLLHSSLAVLDRVVSEKSGSRTPFLFHYTFLVRCWPTWVCYLTTLLIVSAMFVLGLALDEHFHRLPFLFLFFAIIISSGLFDRGSGAFAVLLSVFFANWFLMTPTGTIRVENTGDLIALSCFMALDLATAAIVQALHRVASGLLETNQKLTASENEK